MIPVLKPNPPSIEKWSKYLQMSYDSHIFSNGGPCVRLLEQRLKDYLNLEHEPVLMCNATIALTIVLQAMDLKDSTVMCPDFTFSATPHSIINAGGYHFLVDVDDDLQLNLDALKDDIRFLKHVGTKSMVVVQALGYACDYKKYEEYAAEHGLKLIFDSAALLGAKYSDGKMVGCGGDCEIFSLHITKTFGIGEGALITSKNKELLDLCRKISNFGFNKNGESEIIGTNSKCSEFHAAVGLSVLDEIDEKMARKQTAADRYKQLLSNLPVRLINQNSAHQVFPVIFENKKSRDRVQTALSEQNIMTRLYYIPIHRQPYFNQRGDFRPERFPNSTFFADRILCIPFFETIKQEEQELVVRIIRENLF